MQQHKHTEIVKTIAIQKPMLNFLIGKVNDLTHRCQFSLKNS